MTAQELASDRLGRLPGGPLVDEQTREILEDLFLAASDVEVDSIAPRLAELPDTLSPDDCPEIALEGLLSLAGFGQSGAWAFVRDLPAADRRRMAMLAWSIWRYKGTPDGTRALFRALTGGLDMAIWDWVFWRWEVDETDLPMLGWDDPEDDGAYQTSLHLSDPYGTVDRDVVEMGLTAMRPAPDAWTLLWCYMAETFLDGLIRWDYVLGSPSVSEGILSLPPTALARPTFGGDIFGRGGAAADWDLGRILVSLALESTGRWSLKFGLVHDSAGTQHSYTLTFYASGMVRLTRFNDDATTTYLINTTIAPLTVGPWYMLDVRLNTLATGEVQIDVYLDGDLVGSANAGSA